MKFQSIPLIIRFSLTDDPQFYGLEMSLNNILIFGLFHSNNRMVIFSRTGKKIITANTKGPYIYNINIERGWGRFL